MIEVKNVSFSYEEDNIKTLNKVSFKIEEGTWLSILGHNGSGKSTLAKILVGILEADDGVVSFSLDNKNLILSSKTIKDIRKKIGIVFQNPDNQFVGVTVRHDIAFGLENRLMNPEEMEQKVLECAKLVGMEGYLNISPENLSGGQKQRVAIAGALAMDLDIIIFDEATSMLDPEGTKEIIKIIRDLNKKYNKTIITITHNLDFASLSDKVIVLNKGNLTFDGTPKELFNNLDILQQSNLKLPYIVDVISKLDKNNPKQKEMIDSLWELILQK